MSYWVWSPLLPGGAQLTTETVTLSASDSCAVQASDSVSLLSKAILVTDSCAVGATDTYNNLARTDYTFVVLGLAEDTPVIVAVLTASDSVSVQVSDASPSVTVVLTASDSLAVKAIDAYQPFPVTAVLDTFNRSNEGPPPGAGWDNAFADSLQLVGNEVILGTPTAEGAAGWKTPLPSDDQEVFFTIGTVAPPNGSGIFGALLRMQTSGGYLTDSYRVLWQNTGGVSFVELEKYQGGAATQLAYTYLSAAIVSGDQLGVSVIGSTFRVYRNGVLEWTTTDASVTTGRYVGLHIIQNNTVALDNFGGGASAVGGASAFVTEPAVDSLTLGLSDLYNASAPRAIATADSLTVQASEAAPALAFTFATSDAVAVQVSDATPANAIAVSVADSLVVIADDSATPAVDTGSTVVAKSFQPDLICAIQADDAATPALVIVVAATDSCGYTASDLIDISTARPIAAIDSLIVQLFDATPANVLSTGATDSLLLGLTEGAPVLTITMGTTDACAVQASEGSPTTTSVVTASDSCAILASDAINVSASRAIATADTLLIQSAEAAPTLAVSVVASDSLAVQASEAASILAPTSASDACAIQATEAAPNIVQSASFSVADSSAIQASEATPIIGQAFLVADSLTFQASDAINAATARAVSAQESLAIQQTDATTNSLPTSASESLRVGLDDQPAIFYTLSASDSCTLGLTDTITFAGELIILVAKNVTDTVLVNAEDLARTPVLPAEVVAMLLLESVRVTKTWVEVWGGGMRVEDAHHIYATSVRMGPLPPDQDRGGIW